jgi:hypothetical protein
MAPRVRRGLGVPILALLVAGCGGSAKDASALDRTCRDVRASVARIEPVSRLRDAPPALRQTIAIERALLAALPRDHPLAGRLSAAIAGGRGALNSLVRTDPLRAGTMSPLGAGVPAARRATREARDLVRSVCVG